MIFSITNLYYLVLLGLAISLVVHVFFSKWWAKITSWEYHKGGQNELAITHFAMFCLILNQLLYQEEHTYTIWPLGISCSLFLSNHVVALLQQTATSPSLGHSLG